MSNLSNIVEILAKQALGGSTQQTSQSGLGGILGSVLGQVTGAQQAQSSQAGLGGILGSVLGQLGGTSAAAPKASLNGAGGKTLLIAVLPFVLAWIQKQGGLQGALDKLKGTGLNSQVEDWVSTGPGENLSVSEQHVQSLFDDQDIAQVAAEAQADKQDIYGAISSVLPEIIDALTPQGDQTNQQEANDDLQKTIGLVANLFTR